MKKTLIIETVLSPAFTGDPSDSPPAPAGEQAYRICYEDPVEMLLFVTAERMEIVKLLLEAGPLPEEQIALRTGRDADVLTDDLRKLLAGEVLGLNAKYEYCFDYDGLRVTLEWPLPTATSCTNLATEPRTHADGRDADEPQREAHTHGPNPAVEYARRIIHILMGIVVVLIVIGVIMFLTGH